MTFFSIYCLIGFFFILPVINDKNFQREVNEKMGKLDRRVEIIIATMAFLLVILLWPLILFIVVTSHDKN